MDRRLIRVLVALTVTTLVVFVADTLTASKVVQALGEFGAAAGAALSAALCVRVRQHPRAVPAARRYWLMAGCGVALMGGNLGLRGLDSLLDVPALTTAGGVLRGIGVVLLVGSVLSLPFGTGGRAERTALRLDIAAVLTCGTLFAWHFIAAGRVLGGQAAPRDVLIVLASLTTGMVGTFMIVRMVLGGGTVVPMSALRMIGLAALSGGVGSALGAFLAAPHYDPLSLTAALGSLTIAVGAELHLRELSIPAARRERESRRWSRMPYVAVGAVDALLIWAIAVDNRDTLIIGSVAVLLTGIVVWRQVISFRANELAEQRFRLLVQNSADVVAITGTNGELQYISASLRRVLGLDPADVLGSGLLDKIHPDDAELVARSMAAIADEPGATNMHVCRLQHADGSWRWLEVTNTNMTHEPAIRGLVSNGRDITETREVQDRLSHEASHDALTGLANRALFNERVGHAVTHHDGSYELSIVLVDLDDFKIVNDTLGHAAGDALLIAVAERMQANVRPTDTVARLGGDEFAMLLPGLGGDAVDRVLTRIAESLLVPVDVEGQFLSIRASFGVVEGHGGDDADDLLRRADIAMYEAKERGEGGHQRYVPGMETRGAERNRITNALRTAIAEDQLVLHYQPVVTLDGGRITGAEALVRWQHPEQGLLGPGAFIDAAEETGLIVPLGRYVLRAAVREAAGWPDPLTVSVNASARQLREPAFAADVAAALAEHGLPAHRLTIEITESIALSGAATAATLRRLREIGVHLSLDDFGTGASTLSLLATCPVHQIKLDRSFVPGPGAGSAAIAVAVRQLAEAFGLDAVAEGVETEEQAGRLRAIGYERAQGFLFARPMPADEFAVRATAAR